MNKASALVGESTLRLSLGSSSGMVSSRLGGWYLKTGRVSLADPDTSSESADDKFLVDWEFDLESRGEVEYLGVEVVFKDDLGDARGFPAEEEEAASPRRVCGVSVNYK